jgi:hypothetical protein
MHNAGGLGLRLAQVCGRGMTGVWRFFVTARNGKTARPMQRTRCGTGFSRAGLRRHTARVRGAHTGLFPAEAGPTKSARANRRTGFSREGVRRHTARVRGAHTGLFPAEAAPTTKAARLVPLSNSSSPAVSGARRLAARRAFHRAGSPPAARYCRWCHTAAKPRQGRSQSTPALGTHE